MAKSLPPNSSIKLDHNLQAAIHAAMMLYLIRNEDEVYVSQVYPSSKVRWMATVDLNEPIGGSKILNLVDLTTAHDPLINPPHKFIYNIHLLKSNLQKTFRRQMWTEALATLVQMIYQDPVETLRRLPVILLEDSLLYPHLYNKIIWLQFATSKDYILNKVDVQTLVDALATGLESASRYNLAETASAKARSIEKTGFWEQPLTAREAYIGARLRSLAGGMKGDTKFLHVLALRALADDLPLETEYSSVDVEDIEEFSTSQHMVPQAIDFHCCPQILRDLPYKDAIWWHWSSPNTRPIKDRDAELESGKEQAHRIQHEKTFQDIERSLHVYAKFQISEMATKRTKAEKVKTLDSWLKHPKI
jgi:hypothetical protein